jgi:uncharacterized protein YraI
MRTRLILSAAAGALLASSAFAMAQSSVIATTDLNVRSGPGPEYPVIGAIAVDDQAMLHGCIEGSRWCEVSYGDLSGWAYSDYLIADNSGVEVIVTERPAEMEVPVAVYEGPAEPAPVEGGTVGGVAGGVTGAIAGAIIGGPVGAAVGGVAGAAGGGVTGSIIDPNPAVRTYVEENPLQPVYLEGEVVVGATLPETVEVREIPDYEYRYVYVNGQPVLVEPGTNRVVYIVR